MSKGTPDYVRKQIEEAMKPDPNQNIEQQLNKIRSKFEKKMGDAWEKYDSSGYENDLEDYGEDYEKAYSYLFTEVEALISKQVINELQSLYDYASSGTRVKTLLGYRIAELKQTPPKALKKEQQ